MASSKSTHYDVVVYGGVPGGISSAIATARQGCKTLLIEPSPYIGGMMTSGLGRTDIRSLEASGSIFKEFAQKVVQHYTNTYGVNSDQVQQCNQGLWFEPSVAQKIFTEMLHHESKLKVIDAHELVSVQVHKNQLQAITIQPLQGGQKFNIFGNVFIDATYEGDLAAKAGVPYTLKRESRDEWNEEYAGTLYMDYHPSKEVFPGSTGEGDNRIQAYNFRLCLTNNPDNRVAVTKPSDYRREDYISLIEDVKEGRVTCIGDVVKLEMVPNQKTDTNNHHYCLCSTDLPEENGEYPEGDRQTRETVIDRHRQYTMGLLWFLQNEEELPHSFRQDAKQWGYAADEFIETDHFPPQIYVREARRIQGEYTFTENDARLAPGMERAPVHFDSIAVGDYAIDSHATRKREPTGQNVALEGFLGLTWLTEIYQIPFGVMVPQKIDGLLVPVAVSSTHMGLGTIRMEPFWMQLGYAAGIAADLSITHKCTLRSLPIDILQDQLLKLGQRITYFEDIEWNDRQRPAAEYFGTKGFFGSYQARLKEPMTVTEASQWIFAVRQLSGGRRLPVLPASAHILPAGVDMGPRLPKEEPLPAEYWHKNPLLTLSMANRWLYTANKALDTGVKPIKGERAITRGEFSVYLYELIKRRRADSAKIDAIPSF